MNGVYPMPSTRFCVILLKKPTNKLTRAKNKIFLAEVIKAEVPNAVIMAITIAVICW